MRRFWSALLLATLSTAVPSVARASIVERVVAVVADRPILLSELRQRARPHVARVAHLSEAERAAAESEIHRALLDRMIDERLEETAADRALRNGTHVDVRL